MGTIPPYTFHLLISVSQSRFFYFYCGRPFLDPHKTVLTVTSENIFLSFIASIWMQNFLYIFNLRAYMYTRYMENQYSSYNTGLVSHDRARCFVNERPYKTYQLVVGCFSCLCLWKFWFNFIINNLNWIWYTKRNVFYVKWIVRRTFYYWYICKTN